MVPRVSCMIVRAGISTHLPWARIIGEAMRAPDKLARCFADAGAVEAALHGCPAACRLGGRLALARWVPSPPKRRPGSSCHWTQQAHVDFGEGWMGIPLHGLAGGMLCARTEIHRRFVSPARGALPERGIAHPSWRWLLKYGSGHAQRANVNRRGENDRRRHFTTTTTTTTTAQHHVGATIGRTHQFAPAPSRHPTREHVLAAAAAAAAAPPSELDQSRPAHLPISLTLPPHPFPHPELHRRRKNSHSRRHVRRRHTDAQTRARKTPWHQQQQQQQPAAAKQLHHHRTRHPRRRRRPSSTTSSPLCSSASPGASPRPSSAPPRAPTARPRTRCSTAPACAPRGCAPACCAPSSPSSTCCATRATPSRCCSTSPAASGSFSSLGRPVSPVSLPSSSSSASPLSLSLLQPHTPPGRRISQ